MLNNLVSVVIMTTITTGWCRTVVCGEPPSPNLGQRISFEDQHAGEYDLHAGRTSWTAEEKVEVADGKLTVRIELSGDERPAGIRELYFVKIR